ncbi:hypothetical protein [Actinomadura sp. 9N407]|uniref:hypothetical protein n=1 Tax=Actinomadura sp. 9N407 TaxID=3375154 RepID=UPI00379EB95A
MQPSAAQLQDAPPVTMTDLAWEDYRGVRLPRAADDGPRDTRDGLALGYSRTPRGALLAAIHISLRANARWGTEVFEPTINDQIVGPGTDLLLSSARTAAQASKSAEDARGYVVIEGFRWLGYTPETASLDLVSAGPGDSDTTARAATRLQVQWREGDWRVVAPLAGGWGGSAYPVDSLDGFTLFPARGR